MTHKYPNGTKIKILNMRYSSDFPTTDTGILEHSKKYHNCYRFKGYRDVGWSCGYIENLDLFRPINTTLKFILEELI